MKNYAEEFAEFHKWARWNSLNYTLYYGEADDWMEIEINSAAEAENFYMKRASSFKYFIEAWENHMRVQK